MSGIYIPGMEMPTCGATMILIFQNGDVRGMKYGADEWELLGQAIDFPPHGRLIDADALHVELYALEYARENEWRDGMREAQGVDAARVALLDAPTIIPADPAVMYYPQVPGITPTVIAEEVYDEYTDTAGNHHWKGTQSGEHIIPASEEGEG